MSPSSVTLGRYLLEEGGEAWWLGRWTCNRVSRCKSSTLPIDGFIFGAVLPIPSSPQRFANRPAGQPPTMLHICDFLVLILLI